MWNMSIGAPTNLPSTLVATVLVSHPSDPSGSHPAIEVGLLVSVLLRKRQDSSFRGTHGGSTVKFAKTEGPIALY
jgi:hypothetical protein